MAGLIPCSDRQWEISCSTPVLGVEEGVHTREAGPSAVLQVSWNCSSMMQALATPLWSSCPELGDDVGPRGFTAQSRA